VPDTIEQFRGEYEWLSNFYPVPVMYDAYVYRSVEHAYQAAKTLDPRERAAIRQCLTAGKAKRLGATVTLRADWDTARRGVMLILLRRKFQRADLRSKLLATGDAVLIEGNTWGDTYWGVCRGRGENVLGQLLEQVRAELLQ
jgi:ribA/ribD-fused uncharacterized protein